MINISLFQELNNARYGEGRAHRNLFLPKIVSTLTTNNLITNTDAYRNAQAIICKWAELELQGKIQPHTETNIEPAFLAEVFGEALGYTFFAEGRDKWTIEAKYPVNGGVADAAIGCFTPESKKPRAVIELKGPTVNIDRDRFNGRTPVQQCWDYLNNLPDCPWGIVCNFVSFRLYHRDQTPRAYEHFALQDLRKDDVFRRFYYIFQKDGVLPSPVAPTRNIDALLEQSSRREKEVGDELYKYYHDNRVRLIDILRRPPHNHTLENAIRIAQKLIDRVMFIAFCEDRGLLPRDTIKMASDQVRPFERVTNPRWQNFLSLFHFIDQGNRLIGIPPYDGGLFRYDPQVDDLQLEDEPTANFFRGIGAYEFRDEISVEVLGHLFERSVHDIERIRMGGLFGELRETNGSPKMTKSAERKRFGIYYTPPDFTDFIVHNTVHSLAFERFDRLAAEMGIDRAEAEGTLRDPKFGPFWRQCFDLLAELAIVDPACGSGAFLIKAYDVLENLYLDIVQHLKYQGEDVAEMYDRIPGLILNRNLYGVDLSPEAVEITQLALWLRSANQGQTLADLSKNILCGNSLVEDPAVHPRALNWKAAFPGVFQRPQSGFDCVIGNPPWERMNFKKREYFAAFAPHIIETANAAKARQLIEELETTNPDLYQEFIKAKQATDSQIAYLRSSGRYPLAGRGDINTYAVFSELASHLVTLDGRVGLLVPSGIATDETTRKFFGALVDENRLIGLYDFENRLKVFSDVDGRFKFSVLLFGGTDVKTKTADFVFFAHTMEDVQDKQRHISLSSKDIRLLNPNTRTCPIFRTRRDAQITKTIYRRIPILVDENRKEGGNPWSIKYMLMFHQSFDANLFLGPEFFDSNGFVFEGNVWRKKTSRYLPLYEAKMVQAYDHRAASVVLDTTNWARQGQNEETYLVQHQNPEFVVQPRWWIDENEVDKKLEGVDPRKVIVFKNVTSPTNQRTMIATFAPRCGVVHSAPLMLTGTDIGPRLTACLLGNLNAFVYDFVCRQKIGGVNLSYYIINQLPTLGPDTYSGKCPWQQWIKLEKWISDRVLKLTCTANDMIPLAEAAGLEPTVNRWDEAERADLMAQLDAAYFVLYGVSRSDAEYILSTFQGLYDRQREQFISPVAEQILRYFDEYSQS